ncbi:MAG: bifunctional UDP-sugar hydrolase/5'-nucleotidase [Candidatus Cloacimonadaceae bacterium]|jgi:2',3'-cyclic-nucleotide 2'-phosphodiesterase (5'-nucleotidase family)|nr:bifunctional metallophosphatase/5'-nucleotidase [Candidatus Cloacimonadota bacterium]MCK9179068.1 bifunctional metallophosphatase/5'-nucleotidase [Candidatus Cloacimonadota bacterium]MDY0128016.1 bifunctional UDP-sugar hydrolase/5'-nucleotidase [Candidatus Cloacimonadaceae bacterium]
MKKTALFISWMGLLILAACSSNLRLLHTNDSHAAYQPAADGIGGYLALEYHLEQARHEKTPSLYLDAGDMQTGSIFSSLSYDSLQGGAVLEVFDRLGLDAATPGNHEFDVSYDHAKALMEKAEFPFYSANLLDADGSSFARAPYGIFQKGKLKIGVIGLTIDSLPERVKPENVAPITILPYTEAIDRIIAEVDAKSDLIILLTHNGWEADSLLATQLDNRVDIIVGGHSHLSIPQPTQVNGIYMLSAGSHLRYLGIADLKVKKDRITKFDNRLLPLSQPPAEYQSELAPFLNLTIGELERSLSKVAGNLPFAFRVDKFQLTQGSIWIAEALLREYPQADLAMINNGGLRKHLPAGPVTLKDLHEYIPFGNTIALFSCTGRDILSAQARNKSIALEKPYDIMTVSSPSWLSEQSSAFMIGENELDPDRLYRVVTHDYIISQWDKYLDFEPQAIDETGDLFLDAIIRQVQQQLNE